MNDPQLQLQVLKSRLPSYRPDLASLERALRDPSVSFAMGEIRRIAERVLRELPGRKPEEGDRSSLMLDDLIRQAMESDLITVGVEVYLRTIQGNANPGCHWQEKSLERSHVQIALIALVETLEWFCLERRLRKPIEKGGGKDRNKPQPYLDLIRQYGKSGELVHALRAAASARILWPDDIRFVQEQVSLWLKCGSVQRAYDDAKGYCEAHADKFDAKRIMAELETELVRKGYELKGQKPMKTLAGATMKIGSLLRYAETTEDKLQACTCAVNTATLLFVKSNPAKAGDLAGTALTIAQEVLDSLPLPAKEPPAKEPPAEEQRAAEQHCTALTIAGQAAAIVSLMAGGDLTEAKEYLAQTAGLLEKAWRSRLAIYGPARRNLRALGIDGTQYEDLRELLKAPGVVAFTGHMMDTWTRKVPRFPVEKEDAATASIATALEKMDARIGVASGTCGGDVIFLEQILNRGGEIHIVLPYPVDRFERDCLAGNAQQKTGYQNNPAKGGDWITRFRKVWNQATSQMILSDHCAWDNAMASECCNRTSLGLALLKAEALAAKASLLALWDGLPGDKFGGTHSMVEYARERPEVVDIIRLDTLIQKNPLEKKPKLPSEDQQICAMLFANISGFSNVNEKELPTFHDVYLQPLAELISSVKRTRQGLLEYNTWGDGLFCVFSTMASAGGFGLALQELGDGIDRGVGLPADFGVRVSLHAGPVYRIDDPVLRRPSYIGAHVNRAAHIEARTPPGQVYCSQAFAAMAAAEGGAGFACEYVDDIPLAREPDAQPVYVLRRTENS